MGKWILGLVAALVVGIGLGAYFLSNTHALREPLQAYLSERTGLPVTIRGAIRWQLLPPLQLKITGLTAGEPPSDSNTARYGTLNTVSLAVAPLTVLQAPKDPARWTIRAFTLHELTYQDGPEYWRLTSFAINDLQDNRAAPFHTALNFGRSDSGAGDEDPFEESVFLDGKIQFNSRKHSLSLSDLDIDGSMAVGRCNADFALTPSATTYARSHHSEILNVSDLRDTTWSADCNLSSLSWLGERFEEVQWRSTNQQGLTEHELTIGDAFGGTGSVTATVDASRTPVTWNINPTLATIKLERLFAWMRRDLGWRGPLDLEANLQFTGNHRDALIQSAQGDINMVSVNGFLDIKKIKDQAYDLSQLLGKSETVASWPDELNYQSLSANWRINGEEHQFAALLDNLQLNAEGRYAVNQDNLRINADVQFLSTAEHKPLPINPMLENLAIPLRCKGTLKDPGCGIDGKASTRLLGDILAGRGGPQGGTGGEPDLRDKLEQKIEEEVPEQWQDAAKSLLDLLGDAIGN